MSSSPTPGTGSCSPSTRTARRPTATARIRARWPRTSGRSVRSSSAKSRSRRGGGPRGDVRPDLLLALAITGVQPRPEDFVGELLGAVWERPSAAGIAGSTAGSLGPASLGDFTGALLGAFSELPSIALGPEEWDWLNRIGATERHCFTLVRGADEKQALLRFGVPANEIRTLDLDEVVAACSRGGSGIVSTRVGDWAVIYEPVGSRGVGVGVVDALSAGTEAIAASLAEDGTQRLAHARDGALLERRAFGPTPVDNGAVATALVLAGIAPQREDFGGVLLGVPSAARNGATCDPPRRIDGWNDRAVPFTWTKAADQILPHATGGKRSSIARH